MKTGRPRKLTPEQIVKIREMQKEHRPFSIAAIMGLNRQLVSYYCDRRPKKEKVYQCNGIFNVDHYSRSTATL